MVGHRKKLRGHYNPTNWSRKHPNLQKAATPTGEKVLVCVQCVKGFAKPPRKTRSEARAAIKAEVMAK